MPELSVLIPSRNEPWLRHTVEDILKNARADTEVIVILDGAWPVEPLQQHEKVTLVYHPASVGQRAGTNEAARLSGATYVMKADAHCSFAEGFDAELIKAAAELGPDVTQIPLQCNLHVFDWMCDSCGNRTYQGPTPKACAKCKATKLHKEMVWRPRRGVKTICWRLDSDLHFQYAGEMGKRPDLTFGDFTETMACLGACFFMSRERYWQLDGMDEDTGSWGQMGCEVGCKSWLSGGRMVTNRRTSFSHLFRTQGGDFGFPYQIHGSDQERARRYSRSYWRGNKWSKQVRPLSWLLDHFWPVPGWSDTERAKITAAGVEFAASRAKSRLLLGANDVTHGGPSRSLAGVGDELGAGRALVPADAILLAGNTHTLPVGAPDEASDVAMSAHIEQRPVHVLGMGDQLKMDRVGAVANPAQVIGLDSQGDRPNQPSERQPMDSDSPVPIEVGAPVSSMVDGAGPQPAASAPVDSDLGEDPFQRLAVEVRDVRNLVSHDSASRAESGSGPGAPASPGPSSLQEGSHEIKAKEAGIPVASADETGGAPASKAGDSAPGVKEVMPTGDLHGPAVTRPAPSGTGAGPSKGIVFYTENGLDPTIAAACRHQLRRAVNGIPIVSVSINGPCDLGRNIQLPLERSYLSMFEQILRGLEEQDADVVFLCEHDLLYSPSHFAFTPPRADTYYYNLNTYKVDAQSGHALHYVTRQTSGLCAYRTLLLDHYRKRVERVKREGFSRKIGFEPGTHHRPERIDDFGCGDWWSTVPNVDIRHSHNLTPSRWRREEFRSQRNCRGWTESDGVPGWPGKTEGRFDDWLRESLKEITEG